MLVQLRFMQRFPDLFIVDVFFRNTESDVFADRSIEHENRLRNIADVAKPSLIVRLYVDAVREHLPALGMKEAEHNVDDCCFAGTGRANNADRLSDLERHIRVPEYIGIASRIAVGDILLTEFLCAPGASSPFRRPDSPSHHRIGRFHEFLPADSR